MAKIPIILEPGRADGKLATSSAIFDENKGMFQSEINDIQDTLNSDNPNKPLSAKQGKILKELLDNKVIEAGSIPIDTEPTEGNTTHVVSSDGINNTITIVNDNITKHFNTLNDKLEEHTISLNTNGYMLHNLTIGNSYTESVDITDRIKSVKYKVFSKGTLILTTHGGQECRAYGIIDKNNIVKYVSPSSLSVQNKEIALEENDTIIINCFSNAQFSATFIADNNIILPITNEIKHLSDDTTQKINNTQKNIDNIDNRIQKILSFNTKINTDYLFTDNAVPLSKITSDEDLLILGENLFDTNSIKQKIIKNDYGVEISDTLSSYYETYIPVIPNKEIISNFDIERLYYFTKNKTFITRSNKIDANTPFIIPNDVYWVQVQVNKYDSNQLITLGTNLPDYTPYIVSNNEALSKMYIFTKNRNMASINVKMYRKVSDNLNNENDICTNKVVNNLIDKTNIIYKNSIININNNLYRKIISIEHNYPNITIIGQNIFNENSIKDNYIKNDEGIEIADNTSLYYTDFIPCHNKKLISSFPIQRLYYYDENKTFIKRTNSISENTVITIPSEVYFIQVQTTTTIANTTNKQIIYENVGDINIYKPYILYSNFPINNVCSFYTNGVDDITVTFKILGKGIIPEVKSYPIWEPTDVTDEYKVPIGQGNQSLNNLNYDKLLNDYYDLYLNQTNDYIVNKYSLGYDAGNNETYKLPGEIFCYEFSPKHYNKVILLSAGMNACELSGIFGIAYFIKSLMEHTEEGMLALYNTTKFIIIPCICPSCLDSSPIKYTNYNNIRINKNFNYKNSWKNIKELYPYQPVGPYPDSEPETKILKKWLNDNKNADLWIDCHSDTGSNGYSNILLQNIGSDSTTLNIIRSNYNALELFYRNKGYISEDTIVQKDDWVEAGNNYPKELYAKYVCNIPSIMIEQYISSTVYGSDGSTNNDSFGIKNYTTLLRAYILSFCKSEFIIY